MFDALSDKLQRVFSRLSSHGTVSEKDLDEALREVRVALLEADVNFRVVRDFIGAVRERASGAEVLHASGWTILIPLLVGVLFAVISGEIIKRHYGS